MQNMTYMINNGIVYADNTKNITAQGLPSGVYKLTYSNSSGTTVLTSTVLTHDKLINIPDSVFDRLTSEMTTFFTDDTQKKFKENGFVYKKSVLLYGKPGTGKTCIVVQLIKTFLESYTNGLVLYNPSLEGLTNLYKIIPNLTPILIIYEEWDNVLRTEATEAEFLPILDGQLQRHATFYLFTTNYINEISPRLLRPGRMTNIIELSSMNAEQRKYFLKLKLPKLNEKMLLHWVTNTENFTLDELKHTILMVECLNYELEIIVQSIITNRNFIQDQDTKKNNRREGMSNKMYALSRLVETLTGKDEDTIDNVDDDMGN